MHLLRLVPLGARLAAAFAILAAALLVVGLVGVSASRSLDLSSTSSSSANRLKALSLVSSLGLNAQSNAQEIVSHLYVYDGELQNQDVIAWRIGQGNAQVVTQMRQLAPLATDTATKRDLANLAGARDAFLRASTKAVSLSRTETVHHADRRRGAQRLAYGLHGRGHAGPRRCSRPPAPGWPGTSRTRTATPSPPRRPRPPAGSGRSSSSSPWRWCSPRSWPSSSPAPSPGRWPCWSTACAA